MTTSSAPLEAAQIIRTKRDGGELTPEQVRWFLDGYTAGEVADEQAAALMMAVLFHSLSRPELDAWTDAMIASGERLDLSMVRRPTVDKHSTGGVGDKVSLVLCPLVAACGAAVPQLSGRGLGHTGGTLDKLEAIPGWRSTLSPAEMILQLQRVGVVICAPGPGLAPTDAKLYALRDVTGTVESIPLIASSIMSKKIAEGTSALVLDVKVGSGAFMKEIGAARQLAETMVEIGRDHDVRTTAFLTDMSVPLGRAVGNALEVQEAIETLNGRGPADLVDVTLALAREMLELAGLKGDNPENALRSGEAKVVWESMVRAQGGDPNAPLSRSRHHHVIPASSTGYLTHLDALKVGECAWRLGAGRARKEHPVSWIAGVVCLAKPGDRVVEGQPLLELHVDEPAKLPPALEALQGAIEIGAEPPRHRPLIIDVIRA